MCGRFLRQRGPALTLPILLLLSLLMAACTNVQPTIKIGVLASFEGLHRRSGYAALQAVRAALSDTPVEGVGVLPLALDDGGTPSTALRAAQKLLVDPRVVAVVGPLDPRLADAAGAALTAAQTPWWRPYAPSGKGMTPDGDPSWAVGLVQQAARGAAQQGARTLVLAGWTPGWPRLTERAWAEAVGMPVRIDDDAVNVQDNEAVFWMGSPEDGADYLTVLRRHTATAPLWLGPQGDDPVFVERAGTVDRVFWVIWSDLGYNHWVEKHALPSPTAYLVYKAAIAALQSVAQTSMAAPESTWFVQAYALSADGNSVGFTLEP